MKRVAFLGSRWAFQASLALGYPLGGLESVNAVTLWGHKGRFEKKPQNTQPVVADVPYRDDISEGVSHNNFSGWGLDSGKSFARRCFSSKAHG